MKTVSTFVMQMDRHFAETVAIYLSRLVPADLTAKVRVGEDPLHLASAVAAFRTQLAECGFHGE